MSKKKKKQKKGISVLSEVDKEILSQYKDLVDDIETYQYQLYLQDQKSKKKYKRAIKNGKSYSFEKRDSRKKRIVKEMEKNDVVGRIDSMIKDYTPIIRILGRVISLLLLAVLSIDSIKQTIGKERMSQIDGIMRVVTQI